ncbi:S-adenosyl-L-methionine-dependent methyltransferase [Ramaria rubella]|nr:S-adenosyl-L-methionine-dependent methyltransferase [Ramaria rubella]
MHEAIKFYLDGRLSLAPIESSCPKKILELGSGSGAWAIQAAETFPDADVLAIDLTPLPARPLPPNVQFHLHDVTRPFPFEAGTFDIIHARFLFVHLPRVEEVLARTMQLVKPGGWLLLDDLENVFKDAGLGPGQRAFWEGLNVHVRSKGSNPLVPAAFQGILETSELFSEVNAKKVVIPISKWEHPINDIGIRRIAESFRRSFVRSTKGIAGNAEVERVTHEIVEAAVEEMNDPTRNMHMDVHMTWSKRKC